MKKKTKIISLVSAVLCISSIVATVVYAKTDLSVRNIFQTGGVDIAIVDENSDTPITVTPDMYIEQEKTIVNKGADCYIRAKLTCDNTAIIKNLDVSENWKLYPDGYYYYQNSLKSGKSVNFYNGIKVTSDMSNDMAGMTVNCETIADAIQSDNFVPDWNNPVSAWGNVEIKKLNKSSSSTVSQATQIRPLTITYDGNSNQFISNSENFFENISMLMPGGTYTDTININNTSSENINLYFQQVIRTPSALYDKITFNIMSDNQTVYNGTMGNLGNITLATVPANGNSSVTFSMSMANDIDNQYAFTDNAVEWIFQTEDKPEKTTSTGTPEKTTSTGTPEKTTTISTPEKSTTNGTPEKIRTSGEPMTTGSNSMNVLIAMLVLSAITIVITLRRGRKNEK